MSTATVGIAPEPIWRRAEGWPDPNWAKVKKRSYEDYVSRQLRIRYGELEGNMRTLIDPRNRKDQLIAEQVYGYLKSARVLLEASEPSIMEAAAYLNLADRYIVWLYPRDCLRPETDKVLARLEHFKPIGWERFKSEIEKCRGADAESLDESDLDPRKAALDQAIAAVNEALVEENIATHLQIKCLGHLMNGGLCLLAALCLVSPLAVRAGGIKGLPAGPSWAKLFGLDSMSLAIVVGLMGAIGGGLSALMDARRIKMTIDIYQERLLLLEIKPLVGALVSLVLFCLISWEVVPAVSPQGFGSYLLVAFVAGFSEKYFLRLLPLDLNEAKTARHLRVEKLRRKSTANANQHQVGRDSEPEQD